MSDGMLLSSGTFSHKAVSGLRCLAGVSTVAMLAMAPALWSGEAFAQAASGGTAAVQLDTLSVQGSGAGVGSGSTNDSIVAANSYVVSRSSSGTKTNASLREIPQSISVVTQKQLEDRGAQNLADALAYTAGVFSSPQGEDGRFDQLIIRGFDQTIRGVYRDGMRLPVTSFSGFPQEPYGVERIDVLRGPTSGLYGLNDPGGLVNFVSKKPLDVPLREIYGSYGTYNRKQFGFDLSGPANPEKTILYRITGFLRNGGTQADYVDLDRVYIAPAVTFRPSADTSLTLLGNYQKDVSGDKYRLIPQYYTNGSNPLKANLRDRFLGESNFSRFRSERAMAGYEFSHRFDNEWTVRQNLRYAHASTDYNSIYPTGLNTTLVNGVPTVTSPSLIDRSAQTWLEDYGVFTVDTQIQHEHVFDWFKNTALLGIDYSNIKHKSDQRGGPTQAFFDPNFLFGAPAPALVGPIDVLNPTYGSAVAPLQRTLLSRLSQEQTGIYAQDQVKFGNGFLFSANARYDWVKTKTDVQNPAIDAVRTFLDANGIANGIPTNFGVNQNAQSYSGRVGLSYLFDNGLTPYVAAARSFNVLPFYIQTSAPSALGPTIPGAYSITPAKPEIGETIEGGVKYQAPGSNSTLLLSVFDTKKTNALTFDPTDPLQQAYYQTGEIAVKGIEAEATIELAEGFRLISSATALNARVTKDTPPSPLIASAVGNRPIMVPQYVVSNWADYTVQTGLFRGLGFGFGVRYIGDTFGDAANTIRVPDYFLMDASIRYSFDNWRFQVAANNLADRVYVGTCAQLGGYVGCNYGDGRRITGSVTYRW
ncbi:TonB-dependent siderophore receptor [Methylobacterium bullatum]|uniref:Ferrichrome outer membrane transporter/phage receptor n=2 Tax=Methylobacteriaceae TaxID=119045 RepID=A0A679JMZ8_9HYPH|nr:TonB-dependent siderophore receptor [Methylobacterium bullatum]GJD40153.1 Ferrichrome outer membrane transporter/phage receptor [Methylobacterium bullatum]CAA2137345.1 Ferrichrome-iron receptor [Methylobacterium bullatum]